MPPEDAAMAIPILQEAEAQRSHAVCLRSHSREIMGSNLIGSWIERQPSGQDLPGSSRSCWLWEQSSLQPTLVLRLQACRVLFRPKEPRPRLV